MYVNLGCNASTLDYSKSGAYLSEMRARVELIQGWREGRYQFSPHSAFCTCITLSDLRFYFLRDNLFSL